MTFSAADLRMADRHIARAEQHVARQEELVSWLRSRGHSTRVAEQLLADFQATLQQHRAHRDVMIRSNEVG